MKGQAAARKPGRISSGHQVPVHGASARSGEQGKRYFLWVVDEARRSKRSLQLWRTMRTSRQNQQARNDHVRSAGQVGCGMVRMVCE